MNHVYTASKVGAELYINSYSKLYDLDFTILRYGIPYGPRGRVGTVVVNFVERALRGEPLRIQGDGRQARNFIYVEGLGEGNVAAFQAIGSKKTYNLDGARAVSIRELAETVQRLLGKVAIRLEGERSGDFQGQTTSNERAAHELGWRPKIDIEEGIRRYTAWRRATA